MSIKNQHPAYVPNVQLFINSKIYESVNKQKYLKESFLIGKSLKKIHEKASGFIWDGKTLFVLDSEQNIICEQNRINVSKICKRLFEGYMDSDTATLKHDVFSYTDESEAEHLLKADIAEYAPSLKYKYLGENQEGDSNSGKYFTFEISGTVGDLWKFAEKTTILKRSEFESILNEGKLNEDDDIGADIKAELKNWLTSKYPDFNVSVVAAGAKYLAISPKGYDNTQIPKEISDAIKAKTEELGIKPTDFTNTSIMLTASEWKKVMGVKEENLHEGTWAWNKSKVDDCIAAVNKLLDDKDILQNPDYLLRTFKDFKSQWWNVIGDDMFYDHIDQAEDAALEVIAKNDIAKNEEAYKTHINGAITRLNNMKAGINEEKFIKEKLDNTKEIEVEYVYYDSKATDKNSAIASFMKYLKSSPSAGDISIGFSHMTPDNAAVFKISGTEQQLFDVMNDVMGEMDERMFRSVILNEKIKINEASYTDLQAFLIERGFDSKIYDQIIDLISKDDMSPYTVRDKITSLIGYENTNNLMDLIGTLESANEESSDYEDFKKHYKKLKGLNEDDSIKGPFVVAITGKMPGADKTELVDTIDGFTSMEEAEAAAKEKGENAQPMSVEDWKAEFWIEEDTDEHTNAFHISDTPSGKIKMAQTNNDSWRSKLKDEAIKAGGNILKEEGIGFFVEFADEAAADKWIDDMYNRHELWEFAAKNPVVNESLIKSLDELVVGEKYKIDSGLGGSFDVKYKGKEGDKHVFDNISKGWEEAGPYNWNDEAVLKNVHRLNSSIYVLEGSEDINSIIAGYEKEFFGGDKLKDSWVDADDRKLGDACINLSNITHKAKELATTKVSKYSTISVMEYNGVRFIIMFGQPDSFWFRESDIQKIMSITESINESALQMGELKTVDDVKTFFTKLMKEDSLNLHPDTPFSDYVDKQGKDTFTPEQAKKLDAMMDKAFEICDAAGVDIYSIGLDLFKQHSGVDFGESIKPLVSIKEYRSTIDEGIAPEHQTRFDRAIYLTYVDAANGSDSQFKKFKTKEEFDNAMKGKFDATSKTTYDKSNTHRLADEREDYTKGGNIVGQIYKEASDEDNKGYVESYWVKKSVIGESIDDTRHNDIPNWLNSAAEKLCQFAGCADKQKEVYDLLDKELSVADGSMSDENIEKLRQILNFTNIEGTKNILKASLKD